MGVSLKQFDGLMRFYRPRMSARDRFLTYKALNTSGSPMLRSVTPLHHSKSAFARLHFSASSNVCLCFFCSLQDFYKFYEVTGLKWKVRSEHVSVRARLAGPLLMLHMCCLRRGAVGNTGLMTFRTQPTLF